MDNVRYIYGASMKDAGPVARTQQERKAETRRLLLDAAATLFAAHGIDAVSVDAVADEAGRTCGALYAHFGSKHGLLLGLMDEWSDSMLTVLAAEFELSPGVRDRLRAVATNVITEPSAQTRRLMLLERELLLRAARDEEVGTAMSARARQSHQRLARGLAAWMRDGIIAPSPTPEGRASGLSPLVAGL